MDCSTALSSSRKKQPSPSSAAATQLAQSKGTKRGADTNFDRATTHGEKIDQRFKSAKHAAVDSPSTAKQTTTVPKPQPQPQKQSKGAAADSAPYKLGGASASSHSNSSSSSSSSASKHSVHCPAGFDSALWTQLTSRPSPVTIPANSIKLTYLHGLLSSAECASLIRRVDAAGFGPSQTYAGVTPARTSETGRLPSSDPLRCAVRRRIEKLCGGKRVAITSIVRYSPGQQFTPHYDSYLDSPPLRQFTILAYLNTLDGGGGETEFTKLGVKFRPNQGDALFWENHASRNTEHHVESKHAGRPPLSGVKYGLNCFIRFPSSAADTLGLTDESEPRSDEEEDARSDNSSRKDDTGDGSGSDPESENGEESSSDDGNEED